MRASHILLAVAVAAVWGFNFVAIKVGLRDFPPLLFSCLRFALAALPVVVLGWGKGPPVPWRFVIGIGVMLGVVKFPLLFLGIDVGMPAGLASLVLLLQTFFTIGLAVAFLGERPNRMQLIGALVALIGIGMIAVEKLDGAGFWPLVMTVFAAGGWAISQINKEPHRLKGKEIAYVGIGLGAFGFILFGIALALGLGSMLIGKL